MSEVYNRTEWYLVQVDMDQSYPVDIRNYGVYHFQWQIRKYEDCNKYPTMECRFWPEIRTKNQDVTLGNIFPVRQGKLHNL